MLLAQLATHLSDGMRSHGLFLTDGNATNRLKIAYFKASLACTGVTKYTDFIVVILGALRAFDLMAVCALRPPLSRPLSREGREGRGFSGFTIDNDFSYRLL